MATTKSDQFSVNLKLSPTAKNEKPASGGKKKQHKRAWRV